VTWYCSGAVKAVYSLANGNLNNASFQSNGCRNAKGRLDSGEWSVMIENTNGKTFVSNSIEVSASTNAVMTGVSIEDDYDTYDSAVGTMRVEVAPKTETAILNVTFNKNYAGKLYLVSSDKTDGYAAADLANCVDMTSGGRGDITSYLKEVKTLASLTNKKATANKANGGIYYEDATGRLHCKFIVDLAAPNAETPTVDGVTRGKSYYLIWDQEDIADDEPTATATRETLNTSDDMEVPYVVAPDSIAVTKFYNGIASPEVTFFDEDGAALVWWNEGATLTGFESVKIFGVDTSAKSADDKPITADTFKIKEGVATVGAAGKTINNKYAYVKMKTTEGIFAEKSATLESEVSETAIAALDSISLKEDGTTPENAVVTIKGLSSKAPGTVYIMQGDSTNNTFAKVATKDTSKALKSAKVDGATTEVTFEDVFNAKQIGSVDHEDLFVAVYVPDDQELWLSKAGLDADGNGFQLKQEIKSVDKTDMTTAMTNVTKGVAAAAAKDNTPATIDLTLDKIQLLDQFGNKWKGTGKAAGEYEVAVSTTKNLAAHSESGSGTIEYDNNGVAKLKVTIKSTDTVGTTASSIDDVFDAGETFTFTVAKLAGLTATITTAHTIKATTAGGAATGVITVDAKDKGLTDPTSITITAANTAADLSKAFTIK